MKGEEAPDGETVTEDTTAEPEADEGDTDTTVEKE